METFIATSIVTFTLTGGFSSFIRTTPATNVWGTRRRVFGPKYQKLHPKLHINLPTGDYFLSPPSSFYRSNVMATMRVLPASRKRKKNKNTVVFCGRLPAYRNQMRRLRVSRSTHGDKRPSPLHSHKQSRATSVQIFVLWGGSPGEPREKSTGRTFQNNSTLSEL